MTEGTKFRRVVVEERSVRHRCKTYDGFAVCAAGAFLCIIMRDEEEVVLCYTLRTQGPTENLTEKNHIFAVSQLF